MDADILGIDLGKNSCMRRGFCEAPLAKRWTRVHNSHI
jgi:hypothetical protein